MLVKFKTLFFVKCSLISLYLALTIPIPIISSEELKFFSIFTFIFGLILVINITNDYVIICEKNISYKTSFISRLFGKRDWKIYWRDIRSIKSYPTSQGGKIHYFETNKDEKFLVPQRITNFEKFIEIISKKTEISTNNLSYISPLWTYKLLTYLSFVMIIGEIIAFTI